MRTKKVRNAHITSEENALKRINEKLLILEKTLSSTAIFTRCIIPSMLTLPGLLSYLYCNTYRTLTLKHLPALNKMAASHANSYSNLKRVRCMTISRRNLIKAGDC